MSSLIIHGILPGTWKPGPDFTASRDDKGLWTGSQTHLCRKFDFSGPEIQSAFTRGNSVRRVYPQLGPEWWWFRIDSITAEDAPGGLTTIRCVYKGYDQETEGSPTDPDERDLKYELVCGEIERPIEELPEVAECEGVTMGIFEQYRQGFLAINPCKPFDPVNDDTAYLCYPRQQQKEFWFPLTDSGDDKTLTWFKRIFFEGRKTFQDFSARWTRSGTNIGGLVLKDYKNLGKILPSDPPGRPITIGNRNWRLIGITESRTDGTANCTSSWSIHYELSGPSGWDTKKYETGT